MHIEYYIWEWNPYCTVLYLNIYIAPLEVHTSKKRFQCERPREKRAVLRERKRACIAAWRKCKEEQKKIVSATTV